MTTVQDSLDTSRLKLLGLSGAPAQKQLEVFSAPPGCEIVTFQVEEFTSLCPVTNQPDYGHIDIEYAPGDYCLESKSLKLYLQTFRDQGIFWEALSVQIMNDLVTVLQPIHLLVTVHQHARGGIALSATAAYHVPDPRFDNGVFPDWSAVEKKS